MFKDGYIIHKLIQVFSIEKIYDILQYTYKFNIISYINNKNNYIVIN